MEQGPNGEEPGAALFPEDEFGTCPSLGLGVNDNKTTITGRSATGEVLFKQP